MQSFLDENEGWTETAHEFEKELYKALSPILEKWCQKGYRTMEMESIVSGTVFSITGSNRIMRSLEAHKKTLG